MEKNFICPKCTSITISLSLEEFHRLRIYLSDSLYRQGRLVPSTEVYQFDRMLQDINNELRKKGR